MSAQTRFSGMRVRHVVTMSAAALIFGFALGTPGLAHAHDADDYFISSWSVDQNVYIGETFAPLNTGEAKLSMRAGAPAWSNVSSSWFDFSWSGTEDPNVDWTWHACTTTPGYGVWIVAANLGSLSYTSWCADNGELESVAIAYDYFGPSWHTGTSTNVPSGKIDLRGVSAHEFGHAAGWDHHFDSSDPDTDCDSDNRATMCASIEAGKSYWRTLEPHDKHTIGAQY